MSTHPHPEWKRLFESTAPLAEPGRFFSFDELSELAGIDIRSPRGRQQVIKFRRHLLVERELWLENEFNRGYRIVNPRDHGNCATRQFAKARRRIRLGTAIVSHVRLEELSDEERKANADILVRLARIEATVRETHAEIRKIAANTIQPRLPSPLPDK